jgi:capsid assembly protease
MEMKKKMKTNNEKMAFRISSGELFAIRPDYLRDITKFSGEYFSDIRAALPGDDAENAARTDSENIAVIQIIGAITRYENFYSWFFGGTNVDDIGAQLSGALSDPSIQAIVLEIDSPGGQVAGIADLADQIHGATQVKPVVAFVTDLGASAAYWLSAAASKIVVSQAAFVGSIGVVATYIDSSKADEAAGLQEIEIVSSQSPKKRPDPLSDDGRAQIQSQIDAIADIFVNAVANFRGTTTGDVLKNFGQGDVVLAGDAVQRGMADIVGNFDDALNLAEGLINDTSQTALSGGFFPAVIKTGGAKDERKRNMGDLPKTSADKSEGLTAEERKKIVNDAKAEERERIQAIERLATPANMAVAGEKIKAAMFDGTSTSGAVAEMILGAQETHRAVALTERHEDAAKIPPISAGEPAGGTEEEDKKAAAGIAAKDPRKRGIKK